MGRQQRLDLPAQLAVTGAGLLQILLPPGDRHLQGGGEYLVGSGIPRGHHGTSNRLTASTSLHNAQNGADLHPKKQENLPAAANERGLPRAIISLRTSPQLAAAAPRRRTRASRTPAAPRQRASRVPPDHGCQQGRCPPASAAFSRRPAR